MNQETTTTQTVDIKKMKTLIPSGYTSYLGDDFIIMDMNHSPKDSILRYPIRFDGYLVVFCVRGNAQVDINLHSYEFRENTLLVYVPGYIVRIGSQDNLEDMHAIFVAVSKEFLSGLSFDFTQLFKQSMKIVNNPCMILEGRQLDVCKRYLELASRLVSAEMEHKSEILGSLVSSFCYLLVSIWSQNISDARNKVSEGGSVRAKMIFEQFLSLVTEYHSTERKMGFYADKLCLTPKYLSKIVKQASGRNGPDWINSFVVLEAKNMLKYSDLTIKEIVARLNFPNQSVFYKFFKTHTGMTPSDYRKI